MKHETILKKVKKALGVEAQKGYNGKWYAEYDGQVISWYAKKPWDNPDGPLVGELFHVRSVGDESDPMTDYFAGSFRDNATQMINSVCPPPPKFAVGSLVRGKTNKRATRQGYAGKTGLVREIGHYVKIQWMGEEYPSQYNYGYPERDIELVAAAA